MAKKKTKKNTVHPSTELPVVEKVTQLIPDTAVPLESSNMAWIYKISLWVVLAVMVVMSFWYGLSGDEVDMSKYGEAILNFYTSFGGDETVFNMPKEYDRDSILKYYGGFYDTICAVVTKVSPFELFTTRHIINALMGFLAIFFASKIIKKVIGIRAAIFGIWLMFLSPFFLGHAMNNPKDIPMAAFWVMALYGMIRLFTNLKQATWKDYLFAILPIGFTIASRVGGILLIPEMFVLVAFLWYFNFRKEADSPTVSQLIKSVTIVAVGGYLAGCLFWPFGLIDPINNPLFALKEMTNLSVGMKQVFEGVELFSTELPSYYLPKIFTLTNTFAFLAGLILFVVFLWSFRKNKKAALLYFAAFTALFPFAYIIYSGSNVFHAWRHTLFIFPSAIVCASFGWEQLVLFFEKKKLKYVGIGLLALLLLEPLYFITSTFPNTNTYYNALAGGVPGAYGNYEVDFYYNSLKETADYFIKEVLPKQKDSVTLVTNAVHLVPHYFPKDAKVRFRYIRYRERNLQDWDYAVFHIALIPREDMLKELWLPSSTIYKAQVKGKTLSALIKKGSNEDMAGLKYYDAGDYNNAAKSFTTYLETDDKNTSIMNKLADAYMKQGKLAEADATLKQALALNPADLETNYFMGMLMIEQQNYVGASQLFTGLIQANPQFTQGYYFLGIAQMGQGQYETAIGNLNTASQSQQLRGACYKAMGDAYLKLGNEAEARKLYSLIGQ